MARSANTYNSFEVRLRAFVLQQLIALEPKLKISLGRFLSTPELKYTMARARSVSDDIGGESSTEDNPNKRIKLEEAESKKDDDDNDHSEGNKDSPSPTTSDDEAAMEDQKIQPSDTVFCRKMMVALFDFEATVLHKTKTGSGTEESKEKLEAIEDMIDDHHKVR